MAERAQSDAYAGDQEGACTPTTTTSASAGTTATSTTGSEGTATAGVARGTAASSGSSSAAVQPPQGDGILLKQIQWCPSGNPLDGKPGEVLALLATNGMHHGYGYGPGWSVMFGTDHGDITVQPGQWITRHADGRVEVTDQSAKDPVKPGIQEEAWIS